MMKLAMTVTILTILDVILIADGLYLIMIALHPFLIERHNALK